MSTQRPIQLVAELTDQEAEDYAQFLKRVGFSDYRNNAADHDEAYRMLAAGEKIRRALAEAGYAPRLDMRRGEGGRSIRAQDTPPLRRGFRFRWTRHWNRLVMV